jgi:D-threo-aldose 1-dehydrogenase
MKTIILPGTTFACSRFIFGTASLFNVGTKRRRIYLLEAAVANGFTHFDTAPYYGFGMAERDLFHVLKANRNVSVTTKVGIYPPGGEGESFAPILLRKAVGRLTPAITRPTISFELAKARSALEGSLRRLGREHIDIYMLHEPKIELLNTDEWQYWLEKLVKAGTIGNFGLALSADRLEAFLEQAPAMTNIVQVLDSLELKEADVLPRYGKPLQITYGYISAALSRGDTRSVTEILKQALKRNRDGAIIVSTKRVEHLAQYSKIVEVAA